MTEAEFKEENVVRNDKGQFLPGSSGNPNGRPPGVFSIKDEVRKRLSENPEERKAFVDHFIEKNRELAWQMLEGKPPQTLEANVQGEIKIDISEKIAKKYNLDSTPDTESNS